MDAESKLYESTKNQPFAEWLRDVLGKVKGEKIDVAAMIYTRIQQDNDPQDAFRYFLENADEIVSTEEEELEQSFTSYDDLKLQKESLYNSINFSIMV